MQQQQTMAAAKKSLLNKIKMTLSTKQMRARNLIQHLSKHNEVTWEPAKLDAIALELRHLAFQIRALQQAELAATEA